MNEKKHAMFNICLIRRGLAGGTLPNWTGKRVLLSKVFVSVTYLGPQPQQQRLRWSMVSWWPLATQAATSAMSSKSTVTTKVEALYDCWSLGISKDSVWSSSEASHPLLEFKVQNNVIHWFACSGSVRDCCFPTWEVSPFGSTTLGVFFPTIELSKSEDAVFSGCFLELEDLPVCNSRAYVI